MFLDQLLPSSITVLLFGSSPNWQARSIFGHSKEARGYSGVGAPKTLALPMGRFDQCGSTVGQCKQKNRAGYRNPK